MVAHEDLFFVPDVDGLKMWHCDLLGNMHVIVPVHIVKSHK